MHESAGRRRRSALFAVTHCTQQKSSRRAHSVPRSAFGGAMLMLLRVRRVGAPPAPAEARRLAARLEEGLLAPSFFLRRGCDLARRAAHDEPTIRSNTRRRLGRAASEPSDYESGGQEFESLRT